MKVKELKAILETLNDNAEITIVDEEQEYSWDIVECQTCEDHASDDFHNYLDIVINYN